MGKMRGAIVVDAERCKGCNLCAVACPLNLIEMTQTVNRMGYHHAGQHDAEKCNGCSSCAIVCPDGCITVYRKKEE
ncbi:MAG: ferredoxin [Bacteroides sp. 43_108]|nr:MAG: ferredoxin [Bacteroides sp. 43_108]